MYIPEVVRTFTIIGGKISISLRIIFVFQQTNSKTLFTLIYTRYKILFYSKVFFFHFCLNYYCSHLVQIPKDKKRSTDVQFNVLKFKRLCKLFKVTRKEPKFCDTVQLHDALKSDETIVKLPIVKHFPFFFSEKFLALISQSFLPIYQNSSQSECFFFAFTHLPGNFLFSCTHFLLYMKKFGNLSFFTFSLREISWILASLKNDELLPFNIPFR